jgi:hypothetical protein
MKGGAIVPPSFPSGTTLYLNFVTGSYGACLFAGTMASRTLAQLVNNPVTPTGSGMLIGASDNVTVPLSPAVLGGTWWSNTVGTFYCEAVIAYTNASFPRIFEMTDGTDNNRLIARYNTTSDLGAAVSIGGVDTELNNTPYAQSVKFAIAYDASGFKSCLNGGTVQTNAAVVPTLTGLQLGNRNTNPNRQLDGNLKLFSYYKTKLSDAAIQALTT